MKKLLFFALAAAIAALSSCSGGGNKTDKKADSTKTKDSIAKTSSGTGRYKMKSGILTQTTTTMGMTMNMTVYFDDYGNKQCTETKSSMGTNNISLTLDGYQYSINLMSKTGTKTKIPKTGDNKNIDFSSLTADMMKQMKITKLGTEEVMGKTCDKYSMDDAAMSMKATYWVWNGIALKMESAVMGFKSTILTTKIDENATIPADKFEIPKDIKITDFDKK